MYNFDLICRTCSAEGELQSLFTENPLIIADMLTEIIDLKVMKDDKYPQKICSICLEKLQSAYSFKKQCQDIQNKFEQYLNRPPIKEEVITASIKEENGVKQENYEADEDWNDTYDSPTATPEPPSNDPVGDDSNKSLENETKPKKKIYKRNHTCKICFKSFTSSHLQNHMRSHTKEKPFKCDTCGQQFSLKGNYERHRKIHTGERPHVCGTCGRRFLQKTTLNQHLLIHTDETPYMCTYCGRSFKHKSPLQWHIRRKHTNPNEGVPERKPYTKRRTNLNLPRDHECEICHKKFSTKNILSMHMLIHGEKSYLCSHCGKGFVSNNGLQSHLRTHTGEKPHKCPLCNKAFSQIASLRTHRLIHTGERPYTCQVCNQSFKQVNHLKTHRRTHSGEKLYKCSVCAKHFSTNGNLTVHMRTHTGETPYMCGVCNRGFYDSSSMKKHRKKHFADNENNVQEKSFDLSLTKYIEK